MEGDDYTRLDVVPDDDGDFDIKEARGERYVYRVGERVDFSLCNRCGLIAADTAQHDRWHDEIEAR